MAKRQSMFDGPEDVYLILVMLVIVSQLGFIIYDFTKGQL